MAVCPYPECTSEVQAGREVQFCPVCRDPIVSCSACGGVNRSLANRCRSCGREVSFNAAARRVSDSARGTSFANPRRLKLPQQFWAGPIEYRGFIWALSALGQVFRFSACSTSTAPVRSLGNGFGRCPFVIREVQSGSDGNLLEPFLIAAGPQSVQGVSLLTMESREFASCLAGERILSHPEDGHVSVEADAKFVYFLALRDNQLLMKRAHLATGQVSAFPLRDKQVVGPFRVGPHVCAYSKRTLYIMEEAGVREFALPPNFVAWTAAAEGRGLQAQSGRLPHLVRDGAVYVPGMELQTPGFLLIDLASRSPQPAFIPLRQQATFTQDREGRPILAEDKQIVRLDQTGRTTLKQDDQIAGRRPPYVFGNLMAAFARRGGGEFLRFYTGSNVHDYPLAMLEHFVEPVGMFLLGSSVMITYVDEELQLGVAIWDF